MNVRDIISQALIHYDAGQTVIRYLKKKSFQMTGNKTNDDYKRSIFTFSDVKTKKIILETEVEVLAIYYDKHKVWSWAWSQLDLKKSENYLAKGILHYALNLESNLSYIKSILTKSRGVIKDPMQVDINLAIASSIIKQPYIYSYIHPIENNNLVWFFVLLNKEELDKISEEIKKNPNIETD
jgi:hypothetical protein